MNWTTTRPRIEVAAEWLAAACLGGAVGVALERLALVAPLAAIAIGLVVTGAAWFGLTLVDRDVAQADAGFVPVALPDGSSLEDWATVEDILLLEEPLEELLLDQPVEPRDAGEPVTADTSRVVRLFGETPAHDGEAGAIPAPGEMLAQIEDFLGLARGSAAAAPAPPANFASADASAALHAALADIRRSLRQG